MNSTYSTSKRAIDILVSVVGLVILSPVLIVCAAAVKITSSGPAIYRQSRVGRSGKNFELLKFRSMSTETAGPAITAAGDPRITRVGIRLRRHKLDELPQLVNVILGDMSLVGPRPELSEYVALFPDEYRRIHQIRPGMTDFAAIEYRSEEALLARSIDPEIAYRQDILPAKIKLYLKYLDEISFLTDLLLIVKTLRAVAG